LSLPRYILGNFTRTESDEVNEDGSTDGDEDDLIDPEDPTPIPEPTIDLTPDEDSICDNILFDPNDPSTWPEDLTWEDLEPCI